MEFGIIEDYAVRMVLYLSRNPEKISSRQEISQAMQIPISVLARIGQILEAGGIVEIQRGKKGGYRLRKPPEKITLLEVIESFVGKIAINKCVDNPNFCVREGICPVNFVWKDINEKFRELLKIDFKTLLEKERTLLQNK
ncbi:MAG: RrF2 family transcriptional regulator [Caldimicrobium thiodismutans]|jgi:Rrf2 family protein